MSKNQTQNEKQRKREMREKGKKRHVIKQHRNVK